MGGLLLSPELYAQLRRMVHQILRQWSRAEEASPHGKRGPSQYRERAVVLNENLTAAPDAFHPSKAEASRLRWKVEQLPFDDGIKDVGRYTEAEEERDRETLTVFNHSESAEHSRDTFGVVRWIDGHWVFFGDCEPMSNRKAARNG